MEELRKPELYKAMLAELIGTFFLTLAALLSGSAFAVALTLAAFVYAIGDISGCHINPAVTIGLAVIGRLSLARAGCYIVAQVIGALLARACAPLSGQLPSSYTAGNGFAEFFGIAFLILTVMAVSDKFIPKSGTGVAIGAALAAGLLTSKGILNPAVAVAMGLGLTPGTWAPLVGAIVFASISRLYAHSKAVPSSLLPEVNSNEPSIHRR